MKFRTLRYIILVTLLLAISSCVKKPTENYKDYLLRVTLLGQDGGVVKTEPKGIDCGTNCEHKFTKDTKVVLKAIVNANFEFVAWTGDCVSSGLNCSVIMNSAKNVNAKFKKKDKNHILTVSKQGEGAGVVESTPIGINCGEDCQESYLENTVVKLKARASENSSFSHWSGSCSGKLLECELSMSSNKNAVAVFNLKTAEKFKLKVSKLGKGGRITSRPVGIDCGNVCENDFASKAEVVLTAIADTNSQFVKWSGACSGTSSNCTLSMDKEQAVVAEFKEKEEAGTYKLSVSKSGSGKIVSSPSGIDCGSDCDENFDGMTSVLLNATAETGYEFISWSGDCSGTLPNCKLQMTSDKNVEAKFAVVSTANGKTYYISTSGDDGDDGLAKERAWATFKHADSRLQAGDSLIIMDGTYDQIIRPSHSGNASQGYITYKAEHNFKAILAPTKDTNEATIMVFSCPGCGGGWDNPIMGYLKFEGIIARSIGENSAIWLASADNVKEDKMTHHIVVKNSGFYGSAQETNSAVVALGNNLRDSLFEDTFSYGRSRKAGSAFGCFRVTVRRSVMRYDYWEGDEYKPNDPRTTFSGYNTQDSIFENMIVIDTAPTPPGYDADRAGFAAAGNETPAHVSGSSRNKYLGLIVLNNYGNGIEADGGSGSPNENIIFKNNLSWKNIGDGYAFNVQGNDKGSEFSFMTVGESFVGFRLDPYPHAPITHEKVTNIFSTNNSNSGFYYDENSVDLFKNNSATHNEEQNDLEAKFAPDISTRFLDPVMVSGHERGATIVNRYVNGELTATPLWPYPNEEAIKQHMCNANDLKIAHRVASMGEGWVPAWCKTDKTLTQYIWEFNGAKCPSDICNY